MYILYIQVTLRGKAALEALIGHTHLLEAVRTHLNTLVSSVERAVTVSTVAGEGESSKQLPLPLTHSSLIPVVSSALCFISNCVAVFPGLLTPTMPIFDLSSVAIR